jgi:hypothetical protein
LYQIWKRDNPFLVKNKVSKAGRVVAVHDVRTNRPLDGNKTLFLLSNDFLFSINKESVFNLYHLDLSKDSSCDVP